MKRFYQILRHLILIHILALCLLAVVRLVFFLTVKDALTPDVAGRADLVATAFVRGLWFDNVVGVM